METFTINTEHEKPGKARSYEQYRVTAKNEKGKTVSEVTIHRDKDILDGKWSNWKISWASYGALGILEALPHKKVFETAFKKFDELTN